MINEGGNYKECALEFKEVPVMQLLKLHKYLNWADKKLHSVFFIENKDQITEDLLADFKEDGSSVTVFKQDNKPKPNKSGIK